jgi:hypothetical protein
MPKRISALTDEQISQAILKQKIYKLHDGFNLILRASPNGTKTWVASFYFESQRKYMFFCSYPRLSLADARVLNIDIRKQVDHGINPIDSNKIQIAAENEQRDVIESCPRISIAWMVRVKYGNGASLCVFPEKKPYS